MGKFIERQFGVPVVVSALERRRNIERYALSGKKSFNMTLNGLRHVNLIDSFELVATYFKHDHFVFQAQYLCTLLDTSSRPVLLSLNIDQRQTHQDIIEEVNTSDFSKFVMSPSFDQPALFSIIKRRMSQRAKGVHNEVLFMEFMTALKKQCSRIHQVYRPSAYNDRIKGVDFVVSFLTRPYYEISEVRFNLKSSDWHLDKHKVKHPQIGTFIFRPLSLDAK